MRNLLFASLIVAASLAGCTKKAADASADLACPAVESVTVDELDTMLAKAAVEPVDANTTNTRRRMGVIPGARLLSDSEDFALSELPANKTKPLVFYCANAACGASHDAAQKAITAGYTNVKVLSEGIAGWRKAGKKTATI